MRRRGTSSSGKTTQYRAAFTLPAGYSAPSLSIDLHGDNAATIFVNGTQIGQQTCVGASSCPSSNFLGTPDTFSTSNSALFNVGTNYLQISIWDVGGISGVDYKATVTYTPNSPSTVNTTPAGGTFTVLGTDNNFNTGTSLSGNSVSITASGAWTCSGPVGSSVCQTGPNGTGNPGIGSFLAPGLSEFGLIAKVGSGSWQFVGAGPTAISGTGALIFAMNDT